MAIKYHSTNVNSIEADYQGTVWLEFLDLLGVPHSYNGQTGKTLVVNSSENGLIFSDVTNNFNVKVKLIPSSAFNDTDNPTDAEVYIWASDISNIPEAERGITYILFESVDSSTTNYNYVWRTYADISTIGLIRIRDKYNQFINVNQTPLNYEPSLTGNSNNKNELVESDQGQSWFIDINGNALNFNKTNGNIEIVNPNKGLITHTPGGKRYKQLTADDGTIITIEE